jgi:pimeloyl-ACP methyl ester carboxylesterase
MLLNILLYIKYWLFLELINWLTYLYIYINITGPKFMKMKEKDTYNIIKRLDKLSKEEIEYVIKGCIIYDKFNHKSIDIDNFNLKDLSKTEIINLIGYSLFALDKADIYQSKKYSLIIYLIHKIEETLGYQFNDSREDRYMYRQWGSTFFKFSFRPLIMQIIIRIIVFIVHYWFVWGLRFTYCQINKIGFLYNISNPNKKNLFFIHGFGFGYIPYVKVLYELSKHYNLIIVVLPNISSYSYYDDLNYAYFPSLKLLNDTIYEFLLSKNLNNILLLAHSFGTYITQILRKDERQTIFKKIIMVDPIIFWIGHFKMSLHVENPFIQKYPLMNYLSDNIINFLIYQCLYLKYVCYRVMFGPDFWVYNIKEIVNSNISFILEKGDYIIPAEVLYNKINNKVKCLYYDDESIVHGTVLIEKKYVNDIIKLLEE